jgi:hypothetical protein
MNGCAACSAPVADAPGETPPLRAGSQFYHLACAPAELLDAATDEYRAIVRKGVRYFVEKYGEPASAGSDVGARFVALGRALEGERERRERSRAAGPGSGAPL